MKGGYYDQADLDSYKEFKCNMVGLDNSEKIFSPSVGVLNFIPDIKYYLYNMKRDDKYTFGSCKLVKFNDEEINKHFLVIYYKDDQPEFISLSGTYRSSDAEYRHFILPYNKLIQNIHYNREYYNDIFVDILKYNKIKLKGYNIPEELDLKTMFCLFYIIQVIKKSKNHSDNHSVIELKLKDANFTQDIYNIYTAILRKLITFNAIQQASFLGCKMIPLLVGDMLRVNDIKNHLWMEINIAIIANNFLLNGVTPHLTFTFNKAVLDTRKYMNIYDNEDNLVKLNKSKIADAIHFNLTKSKKLLEEDPNNVYVKSTFDEVSDSIDGSIKITENTIHYTNDSLLIFSQHKGIVLNTYLNTIQDDKLIIGNENYFNHDSVVFQLAYTLYCLNQKGVIHNDLHLKNIVIYASTMRKTYFEKYICYSIPKNEKVLNKKHTFSEINIHNGKDHEINYQINEQENYYIKNRLFVPTIIDFGRSLLKVNLDNESDDLLYKLTIKQRILNVYKTFFPDFYKENRKHLYIEIDDFDTFFNKYAAIDLLRYTTMILASSQFLDIPESPEVKIILDIKHFLEDFLLTTKVRTENPNLLIIKKFFKSYTKIPEDLGTKVKFTDMYCSQAPLYYSFDSYDTLPTFLKIFKMEKLQAKECVNSSIYISLDKEIEEEGNFDIGVELL